MIYFSEDHKNVSLIKQSRACISYEFLPRRLEVQIQWVPTNTTRTVRLKIRRTSNLGKSYATDSGVRTYGTLARVL